MGTLSSSRALGLVGLWGSLGVACATPQTCPPASATSVPTTEVVVEAAPVPALSSWRDGATRKAIEAFVARVTDPNGADYVPPDERIAVFDNDGTLWSEQPMYVQLAFALDRIRAMSAEHPEWAKQQPYKAALEGDMKTLGSLGTEGIVQLVMASHAGMTSEEFDAIVRDWLASARHPTLDRPYTELTFAPMVELLAFLRAHGFKTYIVSGGGVGFMRPWTEAAYGIPPEQVIGSRIALEWQDGPDGPRLVRQPKLDFVDDGPGKPVAIEQILGRRPVFAAGNSDGDLQMLKWTKAGDGARFALLVHHTDAEREAAYDRDSSIGHLDAALTEADKGGWVVVDIAADWAQVFRAPR